MVQANPYAAPTSDLIVESTADFSDSVVFSFNSRAGRLRYLARVSLFTVATYFVLGLILVVALAGQNPDSSGAGVMLGYGVVIVGSVVFGLMFATQRLHDLNQTGWLSVLMFIPLANVVLGLYLLFARGTEGENNYGPPPPPNSLAIKLAALIFPVIFVIGILAAIAIPAYQEYAIRAEQAQMQIDLEQR